MPVLLYFGYRVSAVLLRIIKVKTRQIHYYYQALQYLPKVNSAEDIRACMALVARAETWPQNLSVNQWLHRMWGDENQYTNKLYEELNRFCYQLNARIDISKLQHDLTDLFVRRRPYLKLFN